MPNIYKLSNDYQMLADRLADTADEDGVVDEKLLPVVSEARELVEDKAQSIGCVIKQLRMYRAQIDEEVKRLKAMSATLKSRTEYLENATSAVLQQCGIVRIDGVQAVISFRKSERVQFSDESEIPDEYLSTVITVAPDKDKIKAAIKAGMTVPGAYIAKCQNIQIK